MLAEQRRQAILERLERSESVLVADLCQQFGVSDMTIRRDLDTLERRNLLQKVHGGAVRISKAATEPPYDYKRELQREEKKAISRRALRLITDGDTVALSAGTTTWNIAAALTDGKRELTLVTNSTNIALALQENGFDDIMLSGGSFRTPSDALVGPYAERVSESLNTDTLFLGVHGVHADKGLSTPNVAEAEVNRCLMRAARRVVVVADYTKLGLVALATIAPLSEVDILITDDKAPTGYLRQIEELGVEVVVAGLNQEVDLSETET